MDLTSGGKGRPTLKRVLSQIDLENQKKPRGSNIPSTKVITKTTRSGGAATQQRTMQNNTVSSIPTQNRFDVLHEQPAGNGKQYNDESDESSMQTEDITRDKKIKTAPIVVVDSNATAVHNILNECIVSKKFELRMMKVGIRVNIPDVLDHSAALTTLKEKGIQFYMYHTAATRPVKVVLYGLHDMKCDDLKNLLMEVNIEPDEVKKLNLRKPNYKDQAVYLLYFKPGATKMKTLRDVKHIDHIIVRWEKYHPRTYDNIAQCRNCQKLGHSSVNCNLTSRCLLCSEAHMTDDCPKRIPRQQLKLNASATTVDRSFVKCSNCGANHTANYQGCNARKEFIAAQQRLNVRRGKHKPSRIPRNFDYEAEFPTLGRQQHLPNQQSNRIRSWAEIAQQQQQNVASDVTPLQAVQGLIEDMRSMMTQMMKMMELFIQHVAPRR